MNYQFALNRKVIVIILLGIVALLTLYAVHYFTIKTKEAKDQEQQIEDMEKTIESLKNNLRAEQLLQTEITLDDGRKVPMIVFFSSLVKICTKSPQLCTN